MSRRLEGKRAHRKTAAFGDRRRIEKLIFTGAEVVAAFLVYRGKGLREVEWRSKMGDTALATSPGVLQNRDR